MVRSGVQSARDRGVGPSGLAYWLSAAGYLAGLLLVAWIAVQLLVLQRFFFLQPGIAGIGIAEILLAWRWQHASATSITTRR